jgi:UDP-glucose 4-epimerase
MRIIGKRVLVTGGAGFIGSHLVEELAGDNEVIVADDFSVGQAANLDSIAGRLEIRHADITDPVVLRQLVAGVDVVFHLAVVCLRVSISDPLRSHMVNDLGTLQLLLAARDAGVERFIYCSSSEVYGTAMAPRMHEEHPLNPMTPYAAAKLAGEAYALSFYRTYGFPTIVVRPFNNYGPRSHVGGPSGEVIPKFVARALAGEPLIVFGDGLQTRDYTWVKDSARGIRLAGESDELVGGVVNIAHGEEVTVLELADRIRELTGSRVPLRHLPDRPGDVRRHLADTERARRVLGFEASTSIQQGLSDYVEWVRRLPGNPRDRIADEMVIGWEAAAFATG